LILEKQNIILFFWYLKLGHWFYCWLYHATI